MPSELLVPLPSRTDALAFVGNHLDGLYSGTLSGSDRYAGGQVRADAALSAFDPAGYATYRSEVWPAPRRGASGLSPYIRHGLLSLQRVWAHAGSSGSDQDVGKFRDELLWQEYARHWYARLGAATRKGLRHVHQPREESHAGWDRSMACVEICLDELEDDGWLVNQARMWLSSQWTVRDGGRWQDGEDEFFRHLLDGSRAANRLGWQWTTGAGSAKAYGFSRWQVEKRAPGLCGQCDRSSDCPIEQWPEDPVMVKVEPSPLMRRAADPTADAGPHSVVEMVSPDVVWLTAESLGDADPALAANPNLPAVFVFDEALLAKLQLSAKRLVFLTETLAQLGTQREVRIFRDSPVAVLRDHAPAVTFAPVPGFHRISEQLALAQVHPFPWLRWPAGGSVSSFSAWRQAVTA